MSPRSLTLTLAFASSCDPATGECETRLDCDDDEHCLVDIDDDRGACTPMPGRTPTPALSVIAEPPGSDVVFVIDDGPGTAAAQARIVAALPALVDQAARDGVRLRVAATTATVQTSACGTRADALSGRLAATSCLDRLDDFIADDGADDRWLCTDACTLTTAELGLDADEPWIDLDAYPDAQEATERLSCLVPQGTSGCVRPAPLGAIDFVARRAQVESEAQAGLFRGQTKPHVVVATAEMDCTNTVHGVDAFDPDGARTWWPDPTAELAPPAVCWAAGVECTGAPPVYDDCEPVDRTLDGRPSTTPGASVLSPIDAFAWYAYDLFDLHVIAGIPGIPDGGADGTPIYTTNGDSEFVATHGIGPACTDDTIVAAPALRLYELAAEVHSICDSSYDAALRAAAGDPSPVLCVRECTAAALTITEEHDDGSTSPTPPCDGTEPALTIPVGASSCFAWRPSSPACAEAFDHELLLRTRAAGHRGRFSITPDPWAPSTVVPGCPS